MVKSHTARLLFTCSVAAAALASGLSAAPAAYAQTQTYDFEIPAQNTAASLVAFSQQGKVQLLFPYAIAERSDAPAVRGTFTRQAALSLILTGTGLEVASASDAVIALRERAATANAAQPADDQIVVTGSRLRKAQPTSPLTTITQSQIDASGYSQAGDLMRSLPENFSGGQNPGIIGANATNIGNQNLTNASTVNLRGLGTDATLVLVNGRRLSGDSFFQGADISVIPLAAVQRVEIVPDGASAIYGSDAVAGVVNFVLRRDFTGAEVKARIGGAAQGGGEEETYSLLAGVARTDWHVLGAVEYSRQGDVTTGDRAFTSAAPVDTYLVRPQKRTSIFLSAGWQPRDRVSLSFEGLIGQRQARTATRRTATSNRTIGAVYTPSYSGALTADIGLPADWNLRLTAGASGSHNSTWSGVSRERATYNYRRNEVQYAEFTADGFLGRGPAGALRAAFGGGVRAESYHNNRAGSSSFYAGSRDVRYAFGEVQMPVVAPSETRVGLKELDISLAVRAEHYSDFGYATTPKLGIRYKPFDDLTLRTSWGKSFKAPSFAQLYSLNVFSIWQASSLGYSGVGTALVREGGNEGLKPERATSRTLGADYAPRQFNDLKVSATLFDIAYTDRVVQPVPAITVGLSDPKYALFVDLAPTASDQAELLAQADTLTNFSGAPYNAATIVAVLNNNYQNATSQSAQGLDLSYRQSFRLASGAVSPFASATLLRLKQQTVPAAPNTMLTRTIFNPPTLKLRGGVTYATQSVSFTAIVNHVDASRDTGIVPSRPIGAWTTLDTTLTYRTPPSQGPLDGIKVVVAVTNLFDRDPPRATSPAITYPGLTFDSTNASILGRFASLTVVKTW